MSGWIKLHRSLQDHFIYDFSEPDKALAWIDILLSASYTESKVKIKSRLFSVQKGQWLVSQVTLQKRWKMSQNKVKRLLKLLENDGMISVLTNELTSIITICNFSNYQNDERTNEQPDGRAVERAADEQSNDILRSKEDKEVNKLRKKNLKDNSQQADDPVQEIFDYWCSVMGKSGNAKLTAKRASAVKARLKEGYSVDHIKQAVDGCRRNQFNMGQNSNKVVYDDLELICRSGEKLEHFGMNVGQQQSGLAASIQGYEEFLNAQ